MRKRLVFAVLCMLAIPLLFSPSQNNNLVPSAPFATVALAGRTIVGTWCECGAPGCICDPGENPGGNSATRANDENKSSDQGVSPIRARSQSGSELGTGTLLMALALFLWARLRA